MVLITALNLGKSEKYTHHSDIHEKSAKCLWYCLFFIRALLLYPKSTAVLAVYDCTSTSRFTSISVDQCTNHNKFRFVSECPFIH